MGMIEQVPRSAKISVGLAAGLLATACAGPSAGVNDYSAKSKEITIASNYEYNNAGDCTTRTDSATLKVGQFVVLGEYSDTEGGWEITHPAANQLAIKETSKDTDTFIDSKLSPVNRGDLRRNARVPVTLPTDFSGVIAQYQIHDGSVVNGKNGRKGEYGTFTAANIPDGSVSLEVKSVFDLSNVLDRDYCPAEK